jgi:hypothetical protein
MARTFSQVAREVGGKYLTLPAIKAALEPLGAKAELIVEDCDVERRLQLTTQFVRALRNVSVAEAHRLEHELFEALDAAPTSRRSVAIRDAISLITVRNHIHQLVTALGMPWSDGMGVQSAVSELARFIAGTGGGRIDTEATRDGSIQFEVWTHRPLGPISVAGVATPPWLVGVAKLARDFRTRPAHDGVAGGTHLAFQIQSTTAFMA